MSTIASHYFKTHNDFNLMKKKKCWAQLHGGMKRKTPIQTTATSNGDQYVAVYKKTQKKYASLWYDEYTYTSSMQRYFKYEKGKKYFTELWKENNLKKYRIFTITHAQHTISIWNVQKCDGFEQTNEITKREKNRVKLL